MSQSVAHQKNHKNKWSIDINPRKGEQRHELPSPPGYNAERYQSKDLEREAGSSNQSLIDKKGWDVALGPIKSLPMNIFIMYMAGNTISIFPIMMVGMMFFRPFQAMMGIKYTMKALEKSNKYYLLTIVFILGNLLALGLAVYKCHGMGLLPTHESDWLAFVNPPVRKEFLAGGVSL